MFAPKASSPLRPGFTGVATGSGAEETDALEFAALVGDAVAGSVLEDPAAEPGEVLFVLGKVSPGITGGGAANASSAAPVGSFSFRLRPDVPVVDGASDGVASADAGASGKAGAPASSASRAVFATSGSCGTSVARGLTDGSVDALAVGGVPFLKAGFKAGLTSGNGACGSERALAVESVSGELSADGKSASGDASSDELFTAPGEIVPLEAWPFEAAADADAYAAGCAGMPNIARMMESAIVSGACAV